MSKLLARAGALALVLAAHVHVLAAPSSSAFPSRPVRLVVPTAAGGGVDTAARIVGQKLTEKWGQQVVVDNRAGASGIIGAEIVAHAPPDGQTLLIAPTTFSTAPSLAKHLPYDAQRDFAPISLVTKEPNVVVVNPAVRVKSLADLVAYAKAKPGALNCGFGGVGSTASLSCELFKIRTGTKIVGISYKGNGPAVNALVAGEVQVMFVGLPPTLPLIRSGKLNALALTSRARSPFLPELPTAAEAGVPDFEVTNWIGLLAPARTPRPILKKIGDDVRQALASDEVKERFAAFGVTPDATSEHEFARFLADEFARWDAVVSKAHLRL